MSATTYLRLVLHAKGSLEIVGTPGRDAVAIFVDAQRRHVAIDLSDSEVMQLAVTLARLVTERVAT